MSEEWVNSTTKLAETLGCSRRTIQNWRSDFRDCPPKDASGKENVTAWRRWGSMHPELKLGRLVESEAEGSPIVFEPGQDSALASDLTPGLEGTISRLHTLEISLFTAIEEKILSRKPVHVGPWLEVIEQIRKQEKDLTEIRERQGRFVRVGDMDELEARRNTRFRAVLMAMAARLASSCEGGTYQVIFDTAEKEIALALNALAELDFDTGEEVNED